MFETTQFRDQISEVVAREAGGASLTRYETGIVNYLQNLATGNESDLMEQEIRKAVGTRRGVPEALESVARVVQDASRYASMEKRTTLTLEDVQKAYALNFCQIWPLCK